MNRLRGLAALGAMLALLAGPGCGRPGSDARARRCCRTGMAWCCSSCATRPPIRPPSPAVPSPILGVGAYEALASGRPGNGLARRPAQRACNGAGTQRRRPTMTRLLSSRP